LGLLKALHEARLSAIGIAPMDHALLSSPVEGTDRELRGLCRLVQFSLIHEAGGLLDIRASAGAIDSVAESPLSGLSLSLLGRFGRWQ